MKKLMVISILLGLGILMIPSGAAAQIPALPSITLGVEQADSPEKVSTLLQVLFLLTVLSLAPAIVVMMTSFTRYAIVLSLVRHALGTQQMPPNQIIIGLALLLTFFTMAPVFNQINEEALKPYLAEEITQQDALDKALKPIRTFMLKQMKEKDLNLFIEISKIDKPKNPDEIPTIVILSSFVTSELKTAFFIGFMIYIPFLVIDMVVASVLLSMGMMMLPPFMISLPFKLMLFVLIDGWNILIESMVKSFN
ncbi:MAG: flagellar type III secretion system pore protein FliP [Deltaproteobacteria bacterium]|nr:flagellar type III secretion system pore protein FliP [Deltaproteobacteria bacterium]